MVQSALSSFSGSDPIWGFVALIDSERFTGQADVGLDPRVRLFAVDGRVYCAERDSGPTLGSRLVQSGVITEMQFARGVVQTAGQESLARLFERDATIDRDAVELTVANEAEELLAAIAHQQVGMPEVYPLRYHPAGIHNWFRSAVSLPAHTEVPIAAEGPTTPESATPAIAASTIAIPAPPTLAPVASPPQEVAAPVQATPSVPSPPALSIGLPPSGLPTLAALASKPTLQPPVQSPTGTQTASTQMAPPQMGGAVGLPQLAAGPKSVLEMRTNNEKPESWAAPPNNMAAVQIWEMVDDLFDERRSEQDLVGSGVAPGANRGWLRKKR